MANKIQIKHGSGVPGGGKLSSFELGYATQTGQLYISTTGSDILGITPSSHSHAWAEVTGKPAQATRWPTWSEVTSKPTTATRWPTWSEVTSKPSTFAPSTHAHTGTITTGDYTTHTTQSGSIFLGPMNTTYNHILSSLNVPYWFDRDVKVADGKQVLHAGNYTSYTSPVNLYGTSIPSSLLPGQIYVRY